MEAHQQLACKIVELTYLFPFFSSTGCLSAGGGILNLGPSLLELQGVHTGTSSSMFVLDSCICSTWCAFLMFVMCSECFNGTYLTRFGCCFIMSKFADSGGFFECSFWSKYKARYREAAKDDEGPTPAIALACTEPTLRSISILENRQVAGINIFSSEATIL